VSTYLILALNPTWSSIQVYVLTAFFEKTRSVRYWRVWKYYKDYFPIELVKTTDLDPNKSYLFGSHPHGVLCSGAFCCFGTEAAGFSKLFPGLTARMLTLRGQFMFPGYRDLFMSLGACAATKEGMEALLK
jgi:2-acylglycerol O-acyltransferase 2